VAKYGMSIKVSGTFEEVKNKVIDALKTQGFGVLTEIDVQRTLHQKIGVDFIPYQILEHVIPIMHIALSLLTIR